MCPLQIIEVAARAIDPMAQLYGDAEIARAHNTAEHLSHALAGVAIWNVNSTAHGGGVAELLRSLVGYARGLGIDCRWAVIGGEPEFFQVTKRLHNALHGVPGPAFGAAERDLYERTAHENAQQLAAHAGSRDVVVLHDPQTAGLGPELARRGLRVIWRCHIGSDQPNPRADAAMAFLAPYIACAERLVFTRAAHVPRSRASEAKVIAPTIDPLSPKNQELSSAAQMAILIHTGLLDSGVLREDAAPAFRRDDGALGEVTHAADVVRLGPAWRKDEPLVTQVSRWDRLKDHVGVLAGFARFVCGGGKARLILAGPNVNAVADDPEGAKVFGEVLTAYRALPHEVRRRAELASLPMRDAQQNAAIINALQRQATVVVQKSLQEGFGLTVAEAMWKAKPVIASRVGGIQDQIEHGVSGLLLDDPRDERGFAELLQRVLSNPELATSLGKAAQGRVRSRYLSLCSLYAYADLIGGLVAAPRRA